MTRIGQFIRYRTCLLELFSKCNMLQTVSTAPFLSDQLIVLYSLTCFDAVGTDTIVMLTVELRLIYVHECLSACKFYIWNVNCAQGTTFIFDSRTNVLRKSFETENVSSVGGFELPNFGFMTDALPFRLPMFWNAGFDGIDIVVYKLTAKYMSIYVGR